MFTVSSTLISAFLTGPTDWVRHIGALTPRVEAVAQSCIIVTWWSGSGGIQAWSRRLTGLIFPEMTYNVLSGTLSNQPAEGIIVVTVSIMLSCAFEIMKC